MGKTVATERNGFVMKLVGGIFMVLLTTALGVITAWGGNLDSKVDKNSIGVIGNAGDIKAHKELCEVQFTALSIKVDEVSRDVKELLRRSNP